jgi:alanyl-tRNA synthetase
MKSQFTIDPEEFNIEFMKQHDYIRKKCVVCGTYFWTNDHDRNNCGEPPCSPYTFLKKPPTRKRYNVSEMRKEFISFFEENGHKPINPYPVVSRWRDDLLITIASIADFQPYVTTGISDPPANPLVISQPCLRFEDIQNVGLTAGRHLTIFEMGGAHAFNRRDKNIIYWKDGTVEYHHRFAVDHLGIDEDKIIYKEHFWVGGGNAGPDLEGIIEGLEVSTLVFMMYSIVDNELIETPILTVDTGYGMERWAWLSTGSPTAFHTIYGDLAVDIANWADIDLKEDIIYMDTLYSGGYSYDNIDNVNSIRRKLAESTGYSPIELINKMNILNELYAVLDHSKASIFLIKDGAMPSNVKEGYLTRLLLRRMFRIMEKNNIIEYLDRLISKQIDIWGKDFKEITESRDIIFEVIELEYKKYSETLTKGSALIENIIRKKGELTVDDLIVLYDSHGLPPDYVVDVARKHNININVPKDFHSQVAKRHQSAETKIKEKIKFFDKEYDTKRLYYEKPYQSKMLAKVLAIKDNMVILDRTVFYPQGGGQIGDSGFIVINDNKWRVIETQLIDNNIVHILEDTVEGKINVGDKVKGYVDWDRRLSLMRHHTATHILLGAIKRVLGSHIWQAGAEKRPDQARLDITHYKSISTEELREIERLANDIIAKGIDVTPVWMERGQAELEFGAQIYQGGVVPGKYVRVIKISDWDVEACGGVHVSNTREVMSIKIIGTEKIHEGVIRITYKAGIEAFKHYQEIYNIISSIHAELGGEINTLPDKVRVLHKEVKQLKDQVKALKGMLRRYRSKELYDKAIEIDSVKVLCSVEESIDDVIAIGEALEESYNDMVYLGIAYSGRGFNISIFVGKLLRSKGLSAADIGKYILTEYKGGGKGDPRYFRLGGVGKPNIDTIRSMVLDYVKSSKIR